MFVDMNLAIYIFILSDRHRMNPISVFLYVWLSARLNWTQDLPTCNGNHSPPEFSIAEEMKTGNGLELVHLRTGTCTSGVYIPGGSGTTESLGHRANGNWTDVHLVVSIVTGQPCKGLASLCGPRGLSLLIQLKTHISTLLGGQLESPSGPLQPPI